MAPPTPTSTMLVSGEYFDYRAPDPSVITLDVLQHGLDVPRFNNQTIRPITVLEHSLRVARIAWGLNANRRLAHGVELWALLHDAHEALAPRGDCLRPGKTLAMKAVEVEVDEVIISALGIDAVVSLSDDDDAWIQIVDIVKTADAIALYFEAMLWQPGAIDWAPEIMDRVWEERTNPSDYRASIVDRFLPLIAPRPGECCRTEVEQLLGDRS